MAPKTLFLLIILLICTQFTPSSSIPVSRTIHLMHQSKEMNKIASTEVMKNQETEKRMDIQINDYAPTGPNPFHTPKPPHP
ncbi:hypothetical protein V2J09_019970 [Rumex salicifolius]